MSAHPGGLGLPDVNYGPRILVATAVTTSIALATVLTRVYVRLFIVQNFGIDDACMVFTMCLSFAGLCVVIPEVQYGAGRHLVYLSPPVVEIGLHLNFVTQPIYALAISFVKISIGLFLIRFASGAYRIFIWIMITFTVIYTTVALFTIMFQCENLATLWDPTVKSECFSPSTLSVLSYTNSSLNIFTDFVFAILPAFMLRKLQVNLRTKVSLICVLSLGIFACIAACIKLTIISNYGKEGDFLWDSTELTIWIAAECNTGITAGSLPTLKPLVKRVLEMTSRAGSKSRPYEANKYKLHSLSANSGKKPPHDSGTYHNMDTMANSVKYPETSTMRLTRDNNNSDESILPMHDVGIVCTTEVEVSTASKYMDIEHLAAQGSKVHDVDDRV